ncbi:MAG TPA: 3-hydroxyacyl-CoA dehydrogenase family protein [Bacteroidales bacterium]|nr:3-hydroxyacyl-CoA dehydrogenase family protein [Bacteroidales bacterium]
MTYDERLQNVSILGAAGKMGSGILLLTVVEMMDLSLKPENKGRPFALNAIDVTQEALAGLKDYLSAQVLKIAEKKMVWLRKAYADRPDLIENGEILDQYVRDTLSIVRRVTRVEAAYDSHLIFEAVNENRELKIKLFKQIDQNNPNKPWFFTNTSSVPIHLLDEGAGLGGRILGFHFYNPPAVQKLVELIVTDKTIPEAKSFALDFAGNLKKVVVPSNDFAGFIGNGHFMRDALHGIHEVEKLNREMPFVEAVYMINKITQDYLVRPMGIFQLVDYVGIDVTQFIMKVMNPFLPDEDLHSDLLDQMMEMGVRGGQFADGSQKNGFLKYEKGKPAGIFDPGKKEYVPLAEFVGKCDEKLGALPSSVINWKTAVKLKNKDEKLAAFFNDLKKSDAPGAKLAVNYGQKSNEIGQKLVASNVAFSKEDVNTVLLTGFFHAYGPINAFFE